MGVLNATPDSFFKDSRRRRPGDAISRGLQLEEDGADILDIGGESTRPPFRNVLPVAEEIRRVVPVIEALRKRLKIPISIDTFKAEVARAAISAGAEIVNDIGALRLDRELPKVVASERRGDSADAFTREAGADAPFASGAKYSQGRFRKLGTLRQKSSFRRNLEQADHCRSGHRFQQDA